MSFEKFICWKSEEISSIIRKEAEASEDAVFLAIHTDNKIKVEIDKSKPSATTYSSFLKKFIEDDNGNNVLAVIQGESGSGKSHLIQWLRLHIPQNDERLVLAIPKTETNLYSILKKLIAFLPANEQVKYDEKLTRTETGLQTDKERINEFLSSLARTIERDKVHEKDKVMEKTLIPLLSKLFDDTYLRDEFFNDHEVINNIISIIFRNSSIVRNDDSRQVFTKEHLPLDAKFEARVADPTLDAIDEISDEDYQIVALKIINRNLEKAITRTLSFSPDDLIELMSDIRKYLYKEKIELVLLIEDFAQLQGIDTALLQVLTAEGNGELCKLKWAMAVTTGFFEELEDTVRERMTFKVNMDNPWDKKDITNQNEYILHLGTKYLNAIRLGHTNVLSWYEDYKKDASPIVNHCDNCEHKNICHEAFGEVDGVGLYPFNATSILKMARRADKQKENVFRPRVFINSVLKRNLKQDMVENIEAGEYPPRDLHDDFNTEQLDFNEVDKLTRIDPGNSSRRETLIELWSDSSTIINLDEKIHTAFSLPLLNNINSIDQKTIDLDNKELEQVQIITPIKPEIDNHTKNIEQWGRGKELHNLTVNRLRPFIFDAIVNYIDWSFVSVSQTMNILKKANIYFAYPESNWKKSGLALRIEQSTEMAIILKTLNYMNSNEKDIPNDIGAFARLQEQIKIWAEYLIFEIEKEYAPKDNWNPANAAIELLTLGSLVGNIKPSIDSLFIKKLELSEVLFPQLKSLISKTFSDVDRIKLYQDILQNTYSGKKGGGKTSSFIDIQKVLPVISQLKKDNWRLKQNPSQETRKVFLDLASKYEKWQNEFDDALRGELIERFKWLDELTNRIDIDDIGIKFKNKIIKLRELSGAQAIAGYRSGKLDEALRCNLTQAKTAMETTRKLQNLPSSEIFEDLFPSRKDDAEHFIKLITLYEEMLESISDELKSRTDELNKRTGLSSINLEIESSLHNIKQSFETLRGEDDASK